MKITQIENRRIKIEHPSLKEALEIHPREIFMQTSPEKTTDGKWATQLHLLDGRVFSFEYDSQKEAWEAFQLLETQVLEGDV